MKPNRQPACRPTSRSAAQIAADHLRASGNAAIGWGDARLLHEVAELLGMPHEGPSTERKVLQRIERSHHGVLDKRYVGYPERGLARCRQFWLPAKPRQAARRTNRPTR